MADGNPNPAIPSDMVAVYDRPLKQWLLYYISTDAKIKYFKGPQDGQLEDSSNNPPYDVSYVDISIIPNLPSPKVGNAQLGVAEYVDNSGSSQVSPYNDVAKPRAHLFYRPASTILMIVVVYVSWAGVSPKAVGSEVL